MRHLGDDASISAHSPDNSIPSISVGSRRTSRSLGAILVVLEQSGLETHKSHVEIGGVRFDFLDHKVFSTLC